MEEDEDRTAAQKFAIDVLSVFVPILLAFSAIMMLAMPFILWVIFDFNWFVGEPVSVARTNEFSIALARITFPYLALISATTLFAAVLNSLSRFAAAAAAPILLNICLISAMVIALSINGGDDPQKLPIC